MTPLRILHLITGLEGGGAARALMEVIRKLDRRRFSVSVCTLRRPTQLRQEFREASIPLCYAGSLRNCFFFLRHLETDVVHTHLFHADLFGTLSSKRGRPLISTRHTLCEGGERGYFPQQLYRLISRRMDRIIAVSGAVKRYLTDSLRIQANKVDLIPNGIDLGEYPLRDPRLLRRKLGLNGAGSLIGTACRLVPEKGLDTLIRAMERIRHIHPTVRCLIAGGAPRGGQTPRLLRRLVRTLGLEKEILFVGWQEDISAFLSGLDLFILPSYSESFGRVLLEAMALKRAVIASRVGGIPEIVQDGKEGILVSPRDPEALAEAIFPLLEDAGKREELGQQAFRKVREGFSIDRTVQKLSSLYHSLLNGN